MLMKEKLMPGCLISCCNKAYEKIPRLILKVVHIENKMVVYDALIFPSKKIVYHDLVSSLDFWDHVE